ncbi:MAG: hypothetical protein A2X78_01615 [Gammaproteobacteria bacterium GWE2_37_16]|nr:MAG: hypothetical protein A2X78_01615 [Gammaproteobacteria bacterium GWE2_37_16]
MLEQPKGKFEKLFFECKKYNKIVQVASDTIKQSVELKLISSYQAASSSPFASVSAGIGGNPRQPDISFTSLSDSTVEVNGGVFFK